MVTTNKDSVGARIFVSYAHEDHNRLKCLLTALKPLEKEGLIQVWYDGYLDPGSRWEPRLEQEVAVCDVFLAFLSHDYFASEWCQKEQGIALLRAENSAKPDVIPVLLRDCDWQNTPLRQLQAITNEGRQLLTTDADLDAAGTCLVRSLRDKLRAAETAPSPPASGERPEERLRRFAHSLINLELGAKDAVEQYIDLSLTDYRGENHKTWQQAFFEHDSSGGSHLVCAVSGGGKTTLLKHISLVLLKEDDYIPLYIHLADLVDATPMQALQHKLLVREGRDSHWLPALLAQLKEAGRLIFLLDGYDQVEGKKAEKAIDNVGVYAGPCTKVVASRPLPDAALAAWTNKGYRVWKLDPVSPSHADEYLNKVNRTEWARRLREDRMTRDMLRIPLFLDMLSHVSIPETGRPPTFARVIQKYWDWQTEQENQARTAAQLRRLSEDEWSEILELITDCAWRLAIEGHIEIFIEPVASFAASSTDVLRRRIGKHGLRRFDFVSLQADGGRFRHQVFQAYSAARAIAIELRYENAASGTVVQAISDSLAARFPEVFRRDKSIDPQGSFWLEALGLVPGVLCELHRINDEQVDTEAWSRQVWDLVRTLVTKGLFLMAWRVVLKAEEDVEPLSEGAGWREILWQLVRYRRDSEDHFPADSQAWHYDPLPHAIVSLDGLVARGDDKYLRSGLKKALNKLDKLSGPGTQKLGAYELMTAYLEWKVEDLRTLDDYRIAFVLGAENGFEKLKDACGRFLDARESYVGPVRIAPRMQKATATALPTPDNASFGEWLQQQYKAHGGGINISETLRSFAGNGYAPDSNPHDEPFCRWIGSCFVNAVMAGAEVPMDVSMRTFDSNWTWGIGEAIKDQTPKVEQVTLAFLNSPKLERRISAVVLLGGVANRIKDNKEKVDQFREPSWRLFREAVELGDVELSYSGYHEAARFITDPGQARHLQAHMKRYYAHEVRWHDPYVQVDQIDFAMARMGPDSPYPRKSWFYCFTAPILLENGTNRNGENVDTVLNRYQKLAVAPHEREALAWARAAVSCLRRL